MTITDIIEDISDWIRQNEEPLTYNNWHVAITYKETAQFNYDTPQSIFLVKQIGTVSPESVKELVQSLEAMGIEYEVEANSEIVYVYKTLD